MADPSSAASDWAAAAPYGSAALAFFVGGLMTYVDCYQTMTSRIIRAPSTFLANPWVICLSLFCGALTSVACFIAEAFPDSAINAVRTLKKPAPWRGFIVGASVLLLIRSYLFNIKDSPIGGDFLYQLGRDEAIADVDLRWSLIRSNFVNRNMAEALKDTMFEQTVSGIIAQSVRARPKFIRTTLTRRSRQSSGIARQAHLPPPTRRGSPTDRHRARRMRTGGREIERPRVHIRF
jgi:hypothetical protein